MWSTIWTNRKCTGSSAMQSHKAEGAQPWDSHLVTFPVSGEEFMDALVEGTQWAERLKMFLHLINLAGKRIITSQRKNSVFHLCIWSAGVLKSCVNITYTTTKCDLVSSQAPYISDHTIHASGFWSERNLLLCEIVFSISSVLKQFFPPPHDRPICSQAISLLLLWGTQRCARWNPSPAHQAFSSCITPKSFTLI